MFFSVVEYWFFFNINGIKIFRILFLTIEDAINHSEFTPCCCFRELRGHKQEDKFEKCSSSFFQRVLNIFFFSYSAFTREKFLLSSFLLDKITQRFINPKFSPNDKSFRNLLFELGNIALCTWEATQVCVAGKYTDFTWFGVSTL